MYFKKRDLIKFLNCIKHILLMYVIGFVALGYIAFYVINMAQNVTTKFDIAVVNEDDSTISNMCFNYISKKEISDNISKIHNISYDEAKEGISNGKYAIVLVLPKGCINDIRSGRKTNFTLYVNDKYQIIYKLIKSISDNYAKMLVAGQYGVFAGEEIISKNEKSFSNIDYNEFYNKYIISSNLNLISLAIDGKNTIFKNIILPYANSNVGLIDFYFISFLIFILVVGHFAMYGFYKDDYYEQMISKLKFYKIKSHEFFLGKILLPIFFEIVITIILLLIFKIEFIPLFLPFLVFGLILLNVWTVLCSYLVKNKYNYIVYLLVFIILFTFLNGGILPRLMMPQNLLRFMYFTPYGVCFNLCESLISGIIDIKIIILAIIYIILPYILLTRFKFENDKISY